jgi:peptidoglycan/xylan/chitin deacetylase (PgdA/CDA1 family)
MTPLFIALLGLFASCSILYLFWRNWRPSECLPVLMYHKFSVSQSDALTVKIGDFEEQIAYLHAQNYTFITAQMWLDFLKSGKPLPPKPLLITFDDAYASQQNLAYPVLEKRGAKATIFVTTANVGGTNIWDEGTEPLLSVTELENLNFSVFELGLHSHAHQNFKNLTFAEIRADLQENIAFFQRYNLPFAPAFAYPYGGFKRKHFELLENIFTDLKIEAAFRIGNRLNAKNTDKRFTINRIDIRGNEDLSAFIKNVKYGKRRFF